MSKNREYRSRQRKALWEELNVWLQREKDMEVAFDLCAEERAQKTVFIRQEQAKLRKELRNLERGVHRQRAWNRGDLLY
jgi:hypothetical protein